VMLCLAMLVGTTLAWFTDTASTAVNAIQAGELKVALQIEGDDGWYDVGAGPLQFISEDGDPLDEILWEPGATYMLPTLRIANKGNLAFKFKLLVNGLVGPDPDSADIAEVIDVYSGSSKIGTLRSLMEDNDGAAYGVILPESAGGGAGGLISIGATQGYQLKFHMQETAGNIYQGVSLDGITFTVLATQYTYEEDSFNNTYDADAGYTYTADNAADLDEIFAMVKPGDTIQLNSGVTLPTLNVPAGLNGVTFVSNGADIDQIVIAGDGIDNVTFDGFNLVTNGSQTSSPIWIDPGKSIQTLTFRNTTITGTADVKERTAIASGNAGATLVLENCRFIDVGRPIYDAYKGYKELIIRNCEFNNASTGNGLSWAIAVYGPGEKKVTIDNCTFIGCKEGIMKTQGTKISAFTFTNNTMTDCAPHDPYGLFALSFTDDCVKSVSGNTFDGAAFDGTPFGF